MLFILFLNERMRYTMISKTIKQFASVWKITTLVLIAAFIALLMPYSSYAMGESCSADGYSGTCRDRNTTSCAGYYRSGVCPAPVNNQCCISSQIVCNPAAGKYGYCHNSSGGNTYSCTGGTWNSGYCPGPGDVTCCVLPPQTACGDATGPAGSTLSTGVFTSASSTLSPGGGVSYDSQYVVDGKIDSNYWNAGGNPPPDRWIQIDLGQIQPITGLKLIVVQNPQGNTIHQIYTGPTSSSLTLRRTLNCYTTEGKTMNVVFDPPITDSRYVRITTIADPSWVAWREITVYGSAPGSQTQTPGIIFSGADDPVFGEGDASVNQWVVGGLTYPEVFNTAANPSSTSYQFVVDKAVQAKIKITDMSTICSNLANCTLPPALPNGVYQAKGNLSLNTFTFPSNKNYVFLIDGDLTILGNLVVPNGSTAFFTASGNIIIDRNVGTATNLFPLPAGQLQGIYSADSNFTIDGRRDCTAGPDKMLNVEGAIITNAFGNGGTFQMQRDLCGDNPKYPALTIRLRLDMLLNLPQFLMKQKTTFREEAP